MNLGVYFGIFRSYFEFGDLFVNLGVLFGIFRSFCEFGDLFGNLGIFGSFCEFGDLFSQIHIQKVGIELFSQLKICQSIYLLKKLFKIQLHSIFIINHPNSIN